MNEIDRLKQELEIARETNRRLNRRCQTLEREIAVITRGQAADALELKLAVDRARRYARDLQALYRNERYSIEAWYESYWKQLPKPDNGFIDGIPQRVKEALRLIEEKSKSVNASSDS